LIINAKLFSPKIIAIMEKVAIAGADATKVRLENVYDLAFRTNVGQRIKSLPTWAKHLTEIVAYGTHGMFHNKFEPGSPLGLFIREVVEDLPAELGKRMMNGDLGSPNPDQSIIEANFTQNSSVLELKPEEVKELTEWFTTLTTEEKVQFKSILDQMSIESLQLMMTVEEKGRTILLEILGPSANPKKRKLFEETFLGIKNEVDQFNSDLDIVLESIRMQRRARKERKTKRRGR